MLKFTKLAHKINFCYYFQARFSKESIGKMISDSAVKASVNNGFSRGEHLAVVYNADKIFQKPHYLKNTPTNKAER